MKTNSLDYYVVFDLEATCWEAGSTKENAYKQLNEMETIEIGAVKTDLKFNIIDTFQVFIKPILNPYLSDFCKNLTSIKQEDVDFAPFFKEAYLSFLHWSGSAKQYIAWGQYDYNQLKIDCARNNMLVFGSEKYQNGKVLVSEMRGFKPKGLEKEIRRYNIPLEGAEGVRHRAIFDATITARVLAKVSKEHIST